MKNIQIDLKAGKRKGRSLLQLQCLTNNFGGPRPAHKFLDAGDSSLILRRTRTKLLALTPNRDREKPYDSPLTQHPP